MDRGEGVEVEEHVLQTCGVLCLWGSVAASITQSLAVVPLRAYKGSEWVLTIKTEKKGRILET